MKFDTKDPAIQRKITAIMVILIMVAGIFASWMRGTSDTDGYLVFYNDGHLSIRDHTGVVTDYAYAEITEILYVDVMDVGEVVDGEMIDGTRLGSWYSETYGEYQACLLEDVDSCVFMRTDHGACAFNYESDNTTKGLYEAILKTGKVTVTSS